jgi:hypothetical protein
LRAAGEEPGRRYIDAFALDRFDDERCDVSLAKFGFERIQAAEGDAGRQATAELTDERRTNDQEARSAPGDQASDLHFLVAGAGFEPATSGL